MRGEPVRLSRMDRGVIQWLSMWADHRRLAEIENAPLAREYFVDLLLAIENTFIYGDSAVCILPKAFGSEICGEVADLLIRCVGIERVLCAAAVEKVVTVSARTTKTGGDAAELLHQTIKSLGHSGGHRHRAGGQVVLTDEPAHSASEVQKTLRERFLAACHEDASRGIRLVAKKEILESLT
jgi:hypothetical protein